MVGVVVGVRVEETRAGVPVVLVVATDGEVAAGVVVAGAGVAWEGAAVVPLEVAADVPEAVVGVAVVAPVPAPLVAGAVAVVWGRFGGVVVAGLAGAVWATVGLVVAGGFGRVVLLGRVVVRGTGGGAVRRSRVPVISSSGSLRLLRLARRSTGTL